MIESFLHFVWRLQYFNKENLLTTGKEQVNIIQPGYHNSGAGPDFLNAKIIINEIKWHGQVEIHYKSSQWNQHRHQQDAAYTNVVLHVVWIDDEPVVRADQTPIPTIELKDRVDPDLLYRYQNLIDSPGEIPCQAHLHKVPSISWYTMLDKVLMQRMEQKAEIIEELLAENHGNWEETAYQLVCRSFGFKINNDPMLHLARSLPYKIVLKHRDQIMQVEALLFGQSGLLEGSSRDQYFQRLQKEYRFLAGKYQIENTRLSAVEWKFLRLRPANFPTIRLAQLARLLSQRHNLFSFLKDCQSLPILRKFLKVSQSEYWQNHYHFGKKFDSPGKGLGKASVDNLIINTVTPLMISYGLKMDQQEYVEQAVGLLQQLPPEKNSITNVFKNLDLPQKNGFDSQAYIELYNRYCLRKQCTNCTIGSFLLKR